MEGQYRRRDEDLSGYERAHDISTEGKPTIAGSLDPAFYGDTGRWNSENLLARGSVSVWNWHRRIILSPRACPSYPEAMLHVSRLKIRYVEMRAVALSCLVSSHHSYDGCRGKRPKSIAAGSIGTFLHIIGFQSMCTMPLRQRHWLIWRGGCVLGMAAIISLSSVEVT